MVPAAPRTPEQELRHRQNLDRVEQALRDLPKETRLAVEMHRLGGYTLQEVADHLSVSVATVHRMVRDALVKIGSQMTLRDRKPEKKSDAVRRAGAGITRATTDRCRRR